MEVREYKYDDQVFRLLAKECYVEVWLDKEVRYVGAATNCTDAMPYGISTMLTDDRIGWTPFNAYRTLIQGIDAACHQLLRTRAEKALDFDKICRRLQDEFKGIPL